MAFGKPYLGYFGGLRLVNLAEAEVGGDERVGLWDEQLLARWISRPGLDEVIWDLLDL
jgi:hypothetical protein